MWLILLLDALVAKIVRCDELGIYHSEDAVEVNLESTWEGGPDLMQKSQLHLDLQPTVLEDE